jgi:hypothetical protein
MIRFLGLFYFADTSQNRRFHLLNLSMLPEGLDKEQIISELKQMDHDEEVFVGRDPHSIAPFHSK